MKTLVALVAGTLSLGCAAALAQKPSAPATAPPKPSPRAMAFEDLTGYWVSVVTEDWIYRMVMPAKGDPGSLPVNADARKVAEGFDAAADKAKGEACRMNGAAGNIRRPGRLHISWADDAHLKVEFSAGEQTRTFGFDPAGTAGAPSWTGNSLAEWSKVRNYQQFGPPLVAPVGGTLKVATGNLRPGYLQANGFPYSASAKMTEYYDRVEVNGTPWLIVTTIIEDPVYLREPLYWSTPFKHEADGHAWKAKPCGEV